MKRVLLFLFCLALGGMAQAEEALKISVFSTVLAEMAERIGGEEAKVTSHIPVGADPHEFEPKPSDLKAVSGANLIFLSAKHLEGYVGKLREATGGKVRVVEVGAALPSLWTRPEAGNKAEDPHWWHSIDNVQRAVRVVREALIEARPEKRMIFVQNAEVYTAELGTLKSWARTKMAELPRDKRKLVTSHDALQYLAIDYGFTIYPVSGLSASEQPSSKAVSDLLKVIREQKVKAVFAEDTANPKVLQQITAETGAVLGGQLWVDGLGTGEAATYSGMFRHNLSTIVDALK